MLFYSFLVIVIGIVWVILSIAVIIPQARGELHFAAKYYDHIISQPWKIPYYLSKKYVPVYLWNLLGPVGLVSLAAPLQLLIAAPEFAINLLSGNSNMRNTYFHYQSLITSFIFISAIYGVRNISSYVENVWKIKKMKSIPAIIFIISLSAIVSSYFTSSLPYSIQRDLYPWKPNAPKYNDIIVWKNKLDQDQIKVSTTGRIAPHFTSRQYFYDFSWKYVYADYIVIETSDAKSGYLKDISRPAYEALQDDPKYIKIYNKNGIEVYKKVTNSPN